jgi:DNA-binding transcriptional LysR family regulator
MKDKFDLTDLRAFVKVAELSAFHEAAQQLNISQPALSRRVQKLEATLGVGLLERTTRRVRLTTVGRNFLPTARRLLDDLDQALLSVSEIAERHSGQVSIACVPSAAYHMLPNVLAAFAKRYPRIRVRIVDRDATSVLQSVLSGEVDLGVNLLGESDDDVDFELLLEDPFVLACRKDHELSNREKISWSDLAPYRFITIDRLSGNRLLMDLALAGADWRPKGFYEVQHLSTALGLIEAGLGVAALPQSAIPRRPQSTLVSRPLVNPILQRSMGIIRRRGATMSPAAAKFHEVLKREWSRSFKATEISRQTVGSKPRRRGSRREIQAEQA